MKVETGGLVDSRVFWHLILIFTLLMLIASGMILPGGTYVASADGLEVTRQMPEEVSPGQSFDVTITFISDEDEFGQIGVVDEAPDGWVVTVDENWCTPPADDANTPSPNRAEYVWFDNYNTGTQFTVVYNVTVPADASPGAYTFNGTVGYKIGGGALIYADIGGQSEVNFTAVYIDAPANVSPGQDFVARVCITEVENLDSYQFDITYDADVLNVTDVTSGLIGSEIMPSDGWAFIPPGTQGHIRAVGNVSGTAGVSGSGYLADIHFEVVGSPGDSSDIVFSDGMLFDNQANQMTSVSWINGSINVIRRGDANGDGFRNMGDVTKVERIILGFDAQTPGADANGDGSINMGDVTKIERFILGLDA